jgi:ubiquitin
MKSEVIRKDVGCGYASKRYKNNTDKPSGARVPHKKTQLHGSRVIVKNETILIIA